MLWTLDTQWCFYRKIGFVPQEKNKNRLSAKHPIFKVTDFLAQEGENVTFYVVSLVFIIK